jgi:DtxR family Mn-dependent transcriptional regulator
MKHYAESLTKKERDCIITIVESQEGDFPVRLSDVAKSMKIKSPTAFDLIKRLEAKSLVERDRGMIVLTGAGESVYEDLMMVHRVMEFLLTESGVKADDACKDVKNYDYLMNIEFARKLLKRIGSPKECPHGKPIPAGR